MKAITRLIAIPVTILVVLLSATAAYAHPYAAPQLIAVNSQDPVTFSVYPDESTSPMTGIEITAPPTFAINSVSPPSGWTDTVNGQLITLSGGDVSQAGVTFVTVVGTPSELGILTFPITTIAQDGTRTEWNNSNVRPAPKVTVVNHVSAPSSPRPIWEYFVPSIAIVIFGGLGVYLSKRRN